MTQDKLHNKPHKIELLLFLIAIVIVGIALYYFGPSITGFVIKEFSYADDLNLVVTSSGNYTWQLSNIGELKSVKLDGRVTNYGKARVYIENNGIKHLIFDSTRIGAAKESKFSNGSGNLITGFAVKGDKNNDKDSEKNETESDEDKKKKNKKPEWNGDNEFVVNGITPINLSKYFTDKDGDALVYSADYSADEAEGFAVLIVNETAIITPALDKDFNTTITFTAVDGISAKSQTVKLIVIAKKELVNRAPVWNSNADTFIINGTTIINLSQYFIDEDNDSLTYSTGIVDNITITINNELLTLIPADGWFGSTSTVFTAYDGNNLTIKSIALIVPEKLADGITEPVNITPINITPVNITPKINHAPKWISGIDSFILNKTLGITSGINSLSINLSQYFIDEDNDTLTFSASDAADITETVSASILSLSTEKDNFNSTLTINAFDGNLSASKDVKLIVASIPAINETKINKTNETTTKIIDIDLAYKSGTIYDANDNGEESINGVVDLSVENTKFSFDADASKLCTRWEVYNIEEDKLTTICNGNDECCSFFGLIPKNEQWNNIYYSTFNKDGAGYNNTVSAQVLYYDVNLSLDNPKSEIYYSKWSNLSVKFFEEEIKFFDICVDTCNLTGMNKSSYTLIFEIEDSAILKIDKIKYTLLLDVANSPPLLLKNFSTINISKNKNTTLNLSQYFSDPDGDRLSYSYYKSDNITILFEDTTATFLPSKNVAGVRFTYITANDSESSTASNVFMLNISEEKFKPRVEIGKPVKWLSRILIDVNNVSSINLTLPETASNISIRVLNETIRKEISDEKIKVIEDGKVKNKDVFEFEKKLENVLKKISILEEARLKAASKVTDDEGEFDRNEIEAKLNELYSKKFELEQKLGQLSSIDNNLITANAIAAIALTETILNDTLPLLLINESLTQNIEVEIEYETPAPISIENEVNSYTKQIKVVSETSYEDVISYTTLNDVPQQSIRLYWLQNNENNEKILFDKVNYFDENQNGLIDRIEWIIPHLSNQTFEVTITVLNVQSYPTVGGNWTVAFNTTGTGNLSIYGYNGTTYAEIPDDNSTINDLEYLETRCDTSVLNTTIVCANGEQMPYEVYKIKKRISEIKKRLKELEVE